MHARSTVAVLLIGLAIALPCATALAQEEAAAKPKGSPLLTLGLTSATVQDGSGNSVSGASGFTWEAAYQYPLSQQFAVEGGLSAYDISGGSISADGSGLTLGAIYSMPKWGDLGFGIVPDGVRLFTRKLFSANDDNNGLFWQFGLVFSNADRVESYGVGSVGYKF
jgi:hypothetical protein